MYNLDEEFHGFVYIITHLASGKKYIGKKSFWSKKKPKGMKRRKTVESDWKKYWSSSEQIKNLLIDEGVNAFSREILALCKHERHMNYLEVKYQFAYGVLEEPDMWFNENINGKWYPHLYYDVKETCQFSTSS